ncbi:DEAD/DEAH box helicase [Microbispora corallina]|uniref:Helicase SNF2 n=1 Tax=Microbispora corallina TaxID=83302 RepID=A0ABQ4G6B5_9ACTN|nr:DEAD/DEAH box helicase [Microbispora corallina]GIH42560.1 helicase SNF2 [Microbispora corallina]
MLFSRRRERREIHNWARGLLTSLRDDQQAGQYLLERATAATHRARQIMRDHKIEARLAQLSVQRLDYDGHRVPAAPLQAAGLHSAADIYHHQHRLTQFEGIGPKNAAKLRQGLANALRPVAEDLRPSLDERAWQAHEVDVARALYALHAARNLAQAPAWQVLEPLMDDLRGLVNATRRRSWFTAADDRRRRLLIEHQTLWERAHAPSTGMLLAEVRRRRDLVEALLQTPLASDEVKTAWKQHNARLMALLEQLTVHEGDRSEQEVILERASPRSIPADLASQITALHLDRSLLRKELRLYQELGASFALVVGRAILGDEMGLGKSVQALAAIGHVIARERQHHHLIICPASVIDTWVREIAETVPDVPAFTYRGPDADTNLRRWMAGRGIMVVSYNKAAALVDLRLPHLGFAVVDEARLVKNPASQRTQVTAALIAPAQRCLLMDGTPLENDASEFLNVIELANSDKGRTLRRIFERGERAHREPDRFRRAVADVYLRRNKEEVMQELPPLTLHDELIPLTSTEQREYEQVALTQHVMTVRNKLTTLGGNTSSKMQRLREIAAECRANDQKLLVFSFFREALVLAEAVLGSNCSVLHGDVRSPERARQVEAFERAPGFAALVAQITVGGQGLNLHSASVIVILEPQDKPSTEWQAAGRAHRIGQTRPVTVHRLIALKSLEEKLVQRGHVKAEIFNRVARPSDLAEDIEARFVAPDLDLDALLEEERQQIRLRKLSPAATGNPHGDPDRPA